MVGIVRPENDPDPPRTTGSYDPHLDPDLRFDIGRGQIEQFINGALEIDNPEDMRLALLELKRLQEPAVSGMDRHEWIDSSSILAAARTTQS